MNFSTDVIQEVTELNLDLHADAGVMDRARRQARARRHHLEPSRRRQRAAHEGDAAAGKVGRRALASGLIPPMVRKIHSRTALA